jgi:hypothetical protein
MRGIWNMPCWNALSEEQQRRLIEVGNLEIGYHEADPIHRGAEVAVETEYDTAPGPRFYCLPCAIGFLATRLNSPTHTEVSQDV